MREIRHLAVLAAVLPVSALAVDAVALRLGPNGLGPAAVGMTAQQVTSVLGRPLLIDAKQRKNWGSAECTVGVAGLPGTQLVFDHGRLAAVVLVPPSPVRTRDGIAVGDAERMAIQVMRSQPGYERRPNRYDDGSNTLTQITIGRAAFDQARQRFRGSLVKVNSKRGRIEAIEAGQASYVAMDEHEGDDCSPVP